MKIALLITGLGMGGAENQVVSLADRFVALGHSVLLIALTGETIVLPQNSLVRVENLGIAKTLAGLWSGYRKASLLLSEFKPDAVHSHMVHANIFTRLLRLTVSMPCLICTAHSSNEGRRMRMLAYRLTDALADITTNVSRAAVMSSIKRGAVPEGRMIVMHNGIDCDRFFFDPLARKRLRIALNLPVGSQSFLAVGRFTEAKDYSNLLTAFATLCRVRPDGILWIAGTGIQQVIYESQALELGIAHKVVFLGLRRDISALMSAADIFVLSSAWEGFGLVVAEAMACERLVVSTDAGGVREVLGDVGWLIPIQDSEKLAGAMSDAMNVTPTSQLAKGRAGRDRIMKNYALSPVADRWIEIYRGDYAELH
ncbi:glycosyltransferase [Glaciimonas sp. Gout2]|uniref:glycosyltransferase n=1 Tax=unclassified Glaciimonas TaxID=2644401 RepID=UPI002B22542B|nr:MULTISPECIES: glycosyltransferase [unclassified Glaciimonas]MEB0014186.1 glycosyltransferase [Glaciimonas sp. Cout2]MEB0084360.1 glycosyltransferase [Glaciimonas sp. Gout2]